MKTLRRASALLILSSALVCSACNESQSVDPGKTSSELESYILEVSVDGQKTGDIDIALLEDSIITVTASGTESRALKISDIIAGANDIKEADLEAYLAKYTCDYQSSDGFIASSKGERCKPVSCSLATLSYFNVDSHNMFYDDKSGIENGCYRVKDVTKILMRDAGIREIYVYLDNEQLKALNVADLTTVKVDGKDAVTIENLLKAAKADIDLSQYRCDFRAGAVGEKLVSEKDPSCAASSCADLKDQYIVLDTLTVSDGKSETACYEISDVQGVYVSTIVEQYDSHIVTVIVDGKEAGKVDIAELADKAETSHSVSTVTVAQILEAAGVTADLSNAVCDAGSLNNANPSDDYKPVESGKDSCSAHLACTDVVNMTVSLVGNHELIAGDGFVNCYNVKGFNTLEITTKSGETPAPEKTYDSREITIVVDGKEAGKVDIATLADKATEIDGAAAVSIEQILTAAGVTTDLTKASCEAVSLKDDGTDDYRPSTAASGACTEILACTDVSRMNVSLVDGTLLPGGDYAKCYKVKGFNTLEITTSSKEPPAPEKTYDSYEIEVTLDGTSIGKIDVASMTDKVQVYKEQDVIYLSDIIKALIADIDLENTWCDYLATDGYRPADAGSGECKEIRSCSYTSQAYYALVDNTKNRTYDIAGPACYGTKFIKTIEVYSTNPNK